MSISTEQTAQLKAKLIEILVNKTFTPSTFQWSMIEAGINALSDEDKERIASSLAGYGDDIAAFIRGKLREAIASQLSVEVDTILSAGAVDIDFLYRVLI